MIQDGWGYGASTTWVYYAKNIVRQEKEVCPHLENILVNVCYDANYPYNVNLKLRCVTCAVNFPKAQEILTKKFLEFYGK